MFRVNDCIKFQGKDYTVAKYLGQGGMGHVFSISENSSGPPLALKFLQHYLPDDSNHRSLMNEWDKAQAIKHKNVITYHGFHDGLTEPTTPFLVMELAKDGSLEDFLKAQSDLLDEDVCLGIFHQIVDGMEAVNEVLIHRDIKPDNIFVSDGVFKIADFGLAKIAQEKTRSRTFKGWGTEPYIAPEAYRTETNTIQMDMYSIGHVFYQIAALQHAFGSQQDWERAHLTFVPQPVSNINSKISPKVASVISRLKAKKPTNRYESWNCVRQELLGAVKSAGGHKSAIDNILQKKVSRDIDTEKAEAQAQVKVSEQERKSDILNFQFMNEIYEPIKDFVVKFNEVSGPDNSMKISQSFSAGDLVYRILFDGKYVNIWFHKLERTDVLERYSDDIWGEKRLHVVKPKISGQSVLAWGGIECSDGTGKNIILVSAEGNEYGDWYLLENTHSVMAQHRDNRPDPFAFKTNELVKEIHNVGVMHIYNMKVTQLDTNDLIDFISQSF